jgi:glyoxylase-like metal-dependent hydrolase (beta-lactamase superfamily II)
MKILDNLHAFIWQNPTANNCNSFLIKGDKNILIDPGHDHLFQHVHDGLTELSLGLDDIDMVIITHAHPDHMEAMKKFVDTSTMIAMGEVEMDLIRNVAPQYGEALGMSNFEPQILLKDGDLDIGNIHLQVIHTPGHSPGSICLYWAETKVLITGDVVFDQGVGRTDLPGGNGEQLKESILSLSRLDVDYLLPGHGYIVTGKEEVASNFQNIERMWFAYL